MAAGILNGMEGKLNTRGWRWWVFTILSMTIYQISIVQAILYWSQWSLQVLFPHKLIVFQGAATIFVGLQALRVFSLMKLWSMLTSLLIAGFYRTMYEFKWSYCIYSDTTFLAAWYMVVHTSGTTSSPYTAGWRHGRGRRGRCERYVCEILLRAVWNLIFVLTYRAWRGLKLALQDPKIYIFALYDFCALLGLGFVQFFPTSVMVILFWLVPWLMTTCLAILQSGWNNGFLNHYYTLTCFVRYLTLTFTWPHMYDNLNPRAPWIFAAGLCIINARHAGKPAVVFINLYLTIYMIRCDWWTILAHNRVVVGRHRRLHHRAGHDVYRWSLCILVLNGSWLRWLLDDFGVG